MDAATLDALVLQRVREAGGVTLGELAEKTGARRAEAKACLRRLRRRGLVESRVVLRVEEYFEGPSGTRVAVGYFEARSAEPV